MIAIDSSFNGAEIRERKLRRRTSHAEGQYSNQLAYHTIYTIQDYDKSKRIV